MQTRIKDIYKDKNTGYTDKVLLYVDMNVVNRETYEGKNTGYFDIYYV